MGTIGEYGLHVRALCPLYKPVRLGEQFVTAFETRHLGGGIIHETTLQLVQDRQSVGIGLPFPHCSFHLNIAETVVGKTWVPRRPSPLPLPKGRGAYRVLIVMLTACLALVAGALWSEFLRNQERNLLARLAADGDFGKTREVLPHVADENSPLDGAFRCLRRRLDGIGQNVIPRLHIVALHNLYRRSRL